MCGAISPCGVGTEALHTVDGLPGDPVGSLTSVPTVRFGRQPRYGRSRCSK